MSQSLRLFQARLADVMEEEQRISVVDRCAVHRKPLMPGRFRLWMCPDCARNDEEDDE